MSSQFIATLHSKHIFWDSWDNILILEFQISAKFAVFCTQKSLKIKFPRFFTVSYMEPYRCHCECSLKLRELYVSWLICASMRLGSPLGGLTDISIARVSVGTITALDHDYHISLWQRTSLRLAFWAIDLRFISIYRFSMFLRFRNYFFLPFSLFFLAWAARNVNSAKKKWKSKWTKSSLPWCKDDVNISALQKMP